MGNLFKRGNFVPYSLISILMALYKRGSGEWGPIFLKFIFTIQSNLYIWGIQSYFHLKIENFSEISVMKQNLYYNPWEMKFLFCDFLNYISHCVYLLYKAIQQTVFVVCTVKWQQMFK